jgi:hypothetical protein
MKTFLIKIIVFSILLISGAFILDAMIDKGLKKTGVGEFQTWNDIFFSKINSNVIISGSSRAWVHISPEILDSVLHVNSYNLGIDGYPFNMEYVRYKIFEKYNPKPKLIIQGADFNILSKRKDAYQKGQFLPYLHENLLQQELKEIGFTEFDFYIPAVTYHGEFIGIYRGLREFVGEKHFPADRYKGYCGQNREWDGSQLEKILSNDSIISNVETEIVQLFDSFLNHCEKNDIKVILVFTPQYIKATEFTKNKDEIIEIYHSFSKKYDIPFLDYSYDSLCYDTAYFYNAMHLNKKGAELFSLKLANDIKTQKLYE